MKIAREVLKIKHFDVCNFLANEVCVYKCACVCSKETVYGKSRWDYINNHRIWTEGIQVFTVFNEVF